MKKRNESIERIKYSLWCVTLNQYALDFLSDRKNIEQEEEEVSDPIAHRHSNDSGNCTADRNNSNDDHEKNYSTELL